MMKRIHVIRHAKSSWADEGMRDFDRPLNDRGRTNAPMMAKRLKSRIGTIDFIVCSPAKRTHQTAAYFCEAFGFDEKQIHFVEKIYEAPLSALIETVNALPDDKNEVLFIGHNYGVSHLVNYLTGECVDMPTCAIASIDIPFDQWSMIVEECGTLAAYDYPKNSA